MMKHYACIVALMMVTSSVMAREFPLTDILGSTQSEWTLTSDGMAIKPPTQFVITVRHLHGGRQEGSAVIEVNNGAMSFTVIPTRGMNILEAHCRDIRLGWSSPVRQVVNPAYIDLERRNGLGWLDGFNEFVARCGIEWAGHPTVDNGDLLTLHGRLSDTPASAVRIIIDDKPPYRIHIQGEVVEQTFKFADYELATDISTVPGSVTLQLHDTVTNHADYPREYEIIYHSNFGPPLLEAGSRFISAVNTVRPFDEYAAKAVQQWTEYLGPTHDFGEQVYNVQPRARPDGSTTVMLENAAKSKGVRIDYGTNALPCFGLWKNTDTLKQGYVTGLEPGTSFSNPRPFERKHGRVPVLQPGESCNFQVSYTMLQDSAAVAATAREIAQLQDSTLPQLYTQPEN